LKLTEDEKVEELRRELTGKSKRPFVSVSTESLCELIAAANAFRGTLLAMAMVLKANGNPSVEHLIIQADSIEGEMKRAITTLFR